MAKLEIKAKDGVGSRIVDLTLEEFDGGAHLMAGGYVLLRFRKNGTIRRSECVGSHLGFQLNKKGQVRIRQRG